MEQVRIDSLLGRQGGGEGCSRTGTSKKPQSNEKENIVGASMAMTSYA